VEKKERLMYRLEYLFGDKYYVETLKIPQDYIRGFQYYCIEDIDFVVRKCKEHDIVDVLDY
jgi:hypothetical protein